MQNSSGFIAFEIIAKIPAGIASTALAVHANVTVSAVRIGSTARLVTLIVRSENIAGIAATAFTVHARGASFAVGFCIAARCVAFEILPKNVS